MRVNETMVAKSGREEIVWSEDDGYVLRNIVDRNNGES